MDAVSNGEQKMESHEGKVARWGDVAEAEMRRPEVPNNILETWLPSVIFHDLDQCLQINVKIPKIFPATI